MPRLYRKLAILVLLTTVLAACTPPAPTLSPPPNTNDSPAPDSILFIPVDLQVGYGLDGDWIGLFFIDPFNPKGNNLRGGPDDPLTDRKRNHRGRGDG